MVVVYLFCKVGIIPVLEVISLSNAGDGGYILIPLITHSDYDADVLLL